MKTTPLHKLLLATAIATCAAATWAATPTPVTVETSVRLSGEIVADKEPGEVILKLNSPIKIIDSMIINGKEMGNIHHNKVMSQIPVYLGDPNRFPNPKVGTKGDFAVEIACPNVGCMVSSISDANAAKAAPAPVAAAPAAPKPQKANGPRSATILQGATLCIEMRSMNKAMAIARANNPMISLPDDCTIMGRSAQAKLLQESTVMPGISLIGIPGTTAFVPRDQIIVR